MKKVNMIFREKKPLFWMALAFVMMIGVLSLCVWPLFSRLSADQALWQDLMRHPLLAQGAMSVVMALQVVLAFLPGEPVELLCGYLFGTIGGMAVCVIGSMIGSALIFLLVRKLGEKAVLRMFPQEKVEELAFLKHKEKLVGLLFIIFSSISPRLKSRGHKYFINKSHMLSFVLQFKRGGTLQSTWR